MRTYLGIDLGTSGVKVLLVDEVGQILSTQSESYPVLYPRDGWSEQHPEAWLEAVDKCISRTFVGEYSRNDVKGVSFGG